jgi:molybdopterin molybdotransferase
MEHEMKQAARGREKLMAYEDALSRVLESVTWKLAVRSVAVEQGLGRVLREDVKAGLDIPPFDKSAMDGYAVMAADTRGAAEGAPVTLRVIEDLPAGKSPRRRVSAGSAARIMTGAPLPAGADAVVMVEQTERDDAAGAVKIFKEVEPRENAGKAGGRARWCCARARGSARPRWECWRRWERRGSRYRRGRAWP